MKTPLRRPRGRPPYPGILTPGEQRVLEALRVEPTNGDIAARLGIGVETVRYHLENIRGKLGIEDRAELAAWHEPEAPRRTRWALAAPLLFFRSGTAAARLGVGVLAAALVIALVTATDNLRPVDEQLPAATGTASPVPRDAWVYRKNAGYLHIAGQTALPDGSVLVVGDEQSRSADGHRVPLERDIALVRISADGRSVFETTHESPGSDRVNSFAPRSDGGVYVVGGTNGRLSGAKRLGRSDAFVAAFGSSGRLEWVRTFGTPGIDAATAALVLEDGEIGVFWSAGRGRSNFSIMKPNGDIASTVPLPERVSIDGALPANRGLIFARGTVTVPATWGWRSNALAAAFTSDGKLVWSDTFIDSSLRLAAYANGVTLFAGTHDPRGPMNEPAGSPNAFVAAYAPSGQRAWYRELSTTGRDTLWPTVAIRPTDAMFLARFGLATGTSAAFPPYTRRASAPPMPGFKGRYLIAIDAAGVVTPLERLTQPANLLGPDGALYDVALEQQTGFGRRGGGPYTLVVQRLR